MRVQLAQTAGFCFGVDRAVSLVEQAVKDANAQLNEVAQNIRYVGLSADEISAIMSGLISLNFNPQLTR